MRRGYIVGLLVLLPLLISACGDDDGGRDSSSASATGDGDGDGDGNHQVSADEPVEISVSGVQAYGSYWYAGGSDLSTIPQ